MIDHKIVQKMANLSRLELEDSSLQEYSKKLSAALTYFDQLSGINTQGVSPMVTPVEIEFRMRADEVENYHKTEELISNAPDVAGHLFKVPPVVG